MRRAVLVSYVGACLLLASSCICLGSVRAGFFGVFSRDYLHRFVYLGSLRNIFFVRFPWGYFVCILRNKHISSCIICEGDETP